jgi:EmrB/QacA subfamily drug resistance transporter
MVLDSTVMAVSISAVVKDLGTTVSKMQLAIACFSLVMAAFMLAGAGLGNRLGRKRAFVIGLVIYACGSFTTALAPTFGALFIGWSVLEGLGAVLVIPAIAALTAANYSGKQRALAFGIIGGISGAAAAAGPVIGGWVTSAYSWRYIFASEVVICLAVVALSRFIKEGERPTVGKGFDFLGVALSALGFGLIVISLVQAGIWGWVMPREAPFTVLGFSPTIPMVVLGIFVVWIFLASQARLKESGGTPLLDPELLRIPSLSGGLATLGVQQFVIAGLFFVLPLYLQYVLGLDALESGLRILPLSVALLLASFLGAALSSRFAARRLVRVGLSITILGVVFCIAAVDVHLRSNLFALAMSITGAGIGIVASQLGNVTQSSVNVTRSNEVGGLQGTAQNLGASLGTALIGAILLSGLNSAFVRTVGANPKVEPQTKVAVEAASKQGVAFVSEDQARAAAEASGLSSSEVDTVVNDYVTSQIDGLKAALGAVAILGLLGLVASRRIQNHPLAGDDPEELDELENEEIVKNQ